MTGQYRETILPLFLVLLMIGSPIATAVGAGAGPSDSETVTVKDNVDAWEFSPIPLQASTDNAATVVDELPTVFIKQGTPETRLPRDSVGVFDAGTTVDFSFEKRSGINVDGLGISDDSVQIHRVRLEEEVSSDDAEDLDRDDVPDTVGELREMLTEERVNSNATFKNITPDSLNEDEYGKEGEFSFSEEFTQSGQYLVMVTQTDNTNDDGIVIDENTGNLSRIDGQVSIVGMEAVSVQEAAASAELQNDPEPGDDLEFDVEANLDLGEETNHMIAVYNEKTFSSDQMTITVPDSIDNETDASDVTVESDIGYVNGVSNVSEDVTVAGRTFESEDGNNTGQFSVVNIVSDIADRANTSEPEINEGEVILNASATGVMAEDSATITVETLDSWEESDEYRFIYIASGDNTQTFSSDTGTIEIAESTGGGGDDGGGGGPVGPPAAADPPTLPDEKGDDGDGTPDEGADDEAPTVAEVREELEQTEPTTETNTPISDSDTERPGVTVRPEGTESVREITFDNEEITGTVDIREWQDPPQSVAQSVRGVAGDESTSVRVPTVTDITPDSDEARNSSANVTLTVSSDRVDNPEDLVVYHERGDSWEALQTTVGDTGDGEVELVARTDSFSLFAVAEVTDDGQTDDGATDESGDGPGAAVIIGLLIVLSLIAGAAFAYSNQQSNQQPPGNDEL